MSIELFGFTDYAVYLDLSFYPSMCGLWFDGGPVVGGYFVDVFSMLSVFV